MRILCLDVGEKKIGLALSDSTRSIAQGLRVYRRGSLVEDVEELKRLVRDNEVGEVVVGLPKDMSGKVGKRAQATLEFVAGIEPHLGVPVVLWDERFSTNEAHRFFDMTEVTHKKRKPLLDIVASQIILQGYLDAQKSR